MPVEVSIHAPARGATRPLGEEHPSGLFQSTPPRGGRRSWPAGLQAAYYVSIHAPARGATHCGGGSKAVRCVSIHAPARGATGAGGAHVRGHRRVSIHAPARGATRQAQGPEHRAGVSIHAPARGATRPERVFAAGRGVSIHAPARGATKLFKPIHKIGTCFNPRPRAGGDRATLTEANMTGVVSIHAPARGATPV